MKDRKMIYHKVIMKIIRNTLEALVLSVVYGLSIGFDFKSNPVVFSLALLPVLLTSVLFMNCVNIYTYRDWRKIEKIFNAKNKDVLSYSEICNKAKIDRVILRDRIDYAILANLFPKEWDDMKHEKFFLPSKEDCKKVMEFIGRWRRYCDLFDSVRPNAKGERLISLAQIAGQMNLDEKIVRDDFDYMLDQRLIDKKKFNPETEELRLPNQPKSSNAKTAEKPAVDTKPAGKDGTDNNMDRETCVKTIRELRKKISNKDMNQKIGALCNTVDSITAYINSHPDTAPQVRTLDDYYLPTVIKLVRAYADLESLQRKTREIKKTEEDIVRAIENAQNSFDSILSGLVEGVAEDARAEAAAMQTKMEMDGIISSQGQDIFQGQTLTQAEGQW